MKIEDFKPGTIVLRPGTPYSILTVDMSSNPTVHSILKVGDKLRIHAPNELWTEMIADEEFIQSLINIMNK